MRQLCIKPQIHHFEQFEQFADNFKLSEDDLIFTEQFLFDTFIREFHLACTVVCRDPYGMGEPSDEMIDRIQKDAKANDFRRIIAVGGGSVIDIAKVLALKDSLPSSGLFLKEKPVIKEKELVIVPTTCGTGSEMTNLCIAHIVSKQTKLGLGDDGMYADHAVLIPQLVEGLPYNYLIYSAVDALVHAAESYVSPKANVFTETFSQKACEMILEGFGEMIRKGPEIKKQLSGQFLTASCMAGIAFGNAGVGPVHALAYPLGGNYHVPHGETNYQFFTEVFSIYKREKGGKKLNVLSNMIMRELGKLDIECDGKDTFNQLGEMLGRLQPLKKLREYGMQKEEIEIFSKSVMDNQQRLLVNSYIPFTIDHAREIYGNRY
ncbi:MAG: 4-hydroxybutyrate dehydrogenase [Eubacteriales bacterium]|nr:4-hydroxybutyrate dehydrogenase [Eubacteriales bacterium]